MLPGVQLVHVRNDGVAFGAFGGGGAVVVAVIGVALMALLAYFAPHLGRPLVWLPTGLLLGGALGNIIDRVRDGAVTDFIKLPHWPAFNVADMAITFGVVVLLSSVGHRSPRWNCARRLSTRASASTPCSPARWARARGRSG